MSQGADILTLKNQIADAYVDNFKQEFSDLRSDMPVDADIKNVLLGQQEIDSLLSTIKHSDSLLLKKMQIFLGEKKDILASKNTKEELESLKSDIFVAQEEKKKVHPYNSMRSAVLGGVALTGTYAVASKKFDRYVARQESKRLSTTLNRVIDPVKTKSLMEDVVVKLENEAINPRYTPKMQKKFLASAQEFSVCAQAVDAETMTALDSWGKLSGKLPQDILKKMDITPALSKQLSALDRSVFEHLATLKNTDEIAAFLKAKGINAPIPQDMLRSFAKADHAGDIEGMVEVFSHPQGLRAVSKGIKCIGALDVLFIVPDIFQMMETMNEAELIAKINETRAKNKYNQATFHLMTAVGSLLAEAGIIYACTLTGTAVGGPLGTAIGLAVGALSFVVDEVADRLYFGVVNYYTQNKEDYLRQERSEIKISILATLKNLKKGNTSVNESFAEFFHSNMEVDYATLTFKESSLLSHKIATLEDAYSSVLILEEIIKDPNAYSLILQYKESGEKQEDFVSTLSQEQKTAFKQQSDKLSAIVATRMEYIKAHGNEDKMLQALQSSQGMRCLTSILSESKTYQLLKDQGVWDDSKTCIQNKQIALEQTKQKFGSDVRFFDSIDTLYKTDRAMFWELYKGALFYEPMVSGSKETESSYVEDQTILRHIQHLKTYYASVSLGVSFEDDISLGEFNFRTYDFNYLHSFLLELDVAKCAPKALSENDVKNIFVRGFERNIDTLEISDSVGQNVLYRMAKEFHGYTGHNTMLDLINFYKEGEENSLGFYYDGKWKLNNDNAIDTSFDLDIFDNPKNNTQDILRQLIQADKWNYLFASSPLGYAAGVTDTASIIDTPSENVDDQLNNEFLATFTQILSQEKSYKLPEYKRKTEESVVAYIVQHASAGTYVELPHYLILQAKNAGIGSLEKYAFTNEGNKIIACSNRASILEDYAFDSSKMSLSWKGIRFSETNQSVELREFSALREVITPEEQQYVQYVDRFWERLKELIHFNEEDVDLSKEHMRMLYTMYKKRSHLKNSLCFMQPSIAVQTLTDSYKTYAMYFEHAYLAMLSTAASQNFENDNDTAEALQKAEGRGRSELFDEQVCQNRISTPIKDLISSLPDRASQSFAPFLAQLKQQGIDESMTIESARQSLKDPKTLSHFNALVVQFRLEGGILYRPKNGVLTADQEKIFYSILKNYKIPGDDLPADMLLANTNSLQQEKGKWAAKQIVTSILQNDSLTLDENGKLKNIQSPLGASLLKYAAGAPGVAGYDANKAVYLNTLLKINLDPKNYFVEPAIAYVPDVDVSRVSIQPFAV